MEQKPQEQQPNKELFNKLTNKEQEKKISSPKSNQKHWFLKFLVQLFCLPIYNFFILKPLNYLYSSKKESNEKKTLIELNVQNEDSENNNALAQTCNKEEEHTSTQQDNQKSLKPPTP